MRAPQRARRLCPSALLLGAVASAAGIYIFQVVAARALDERAYAPLTVLWTVQYLVFAIVLHPGETYVAREVLSSGPRSEAVREAIGAVFVMTAALAMGAGVAGLLLADQLLGGDRSLAGVAVAVVVTYGAFVVVRGVLLGAGREPAYAWATASEALLRTALLLALIGVGRGSTTASLAWTLPSGAVAVVVWYLLRNARGRFCWPRWGGGRSLGFLGVSAGAALAAHTLLAGAPVLLAVDGANPGDVSTAFVAFTLARAPLVLGFGGLLAQIVPRVLHLQQQGEDGALQAALLRLLAVSSALTGVAALLGAALGPGLVALVFGDDLAPGRGAAALVSAGSVLAGAGLLVTQAAVALGRVRWLPLPWLLGLCAAALLWTTLPGQDVLRVSTAFAGGELVALTVLSLVVGSWWPQGPGLAVRRDRRRVFPSAYAASERAALPPGASPPARAASDRRP